MLTAPATTLLLTLHRSATSKRPGPPGLFPRGDEVDAAAELVERGLGYLHSNGRILLTAAGVEQARRMKGEKPVPLPELLAAMASCE